MSAEQGLAIIAALGALALAYVNMVSQIPEPFKAVLDRIKIRIYTGSGVIDRDLRDPIFGEPPKYYPLKMGMGWDSLFCRIDDVEKAEWIDAKADVLCGMYHAEHNADDGANHWGDVPVVVCDMAFFGAYKKELVIDGQVRYTYNPGLGGAWVHFNLKTGQVYIG